MFNNYKAKYQDAMSYSDELIEEIAMLKAEMKELRWENESLKLENKKLRTVRDRLFEAGCIIAKCYGDINTAIYRKDKER